TSPNQSQGIVAGIRALGVDPSVIERIAHGSTVATNIVVEGKGASVVLVTTEGFRDVLEIGRGERIKMYDVRSGREPPLISRSSIVEVPERIAADGTVLQQPGYEHLETAIARRQREPEVIAVCFLHSCINSAHETEVAQYLRSRFPRAFVTTSET